MRLKIGLIGLCIILLCIIGSILLFFNTQSYNSTSSHQGKWKIVNETSLQHGIYLKLIKFFDKERGIAVASFSIQKTINGGNSWTTVFDASENKGVYSGKFDQKGNGWVVGTKNLKIPLVLKTEDEGDTWKEIAFDERSLEKLNGKFTYFRDICFDGAGKNWIVGDGGMIQTEIYGQELKLIKFFPIDGGLYNISCNENIAVWAIGSGNSVFRFQDNLVKMELDKDYQFSNVKLVGSNIWLLGQDSLKKGVLLKSQNDGQTWENMSPESAKRLNDLYINDGKGWLIGSEGEIYYSNDDGNSWINTISPTKNNLISVYFVDSKNGWISGEKTTILKYQN